MKHLDPKQSKLIAPIIPETLQKFAICSKCGKSRKSWRIVLSTCGSCLEQIEQEAKGLFPILTKRK